MTVDFYICPSCGSEVKVGAHCPGCVAVPKARRKRARSAPKARKSWEQDAAYDGIDLPDGDFDYDEFIAKEFGAPPHRQIGIKWYWWVTAVVALGAFGWWLFGGLL